MLLFSPETKASNNKIEVDSHTTVAASDVVQTKMRRVVHVVVTPSVDPVVGALNYTAVPSGADDGQFTLKAWKGTAVDNGTPVAATTFGKAVTYVAFGH